jgi:diguanylate cyclase (GGDEF)-like protein/PAS domain S-box-containing protein
VVRERVAVPAPPAEGPDTVLFSCSLSGTVLAAGAALSGLSGRPLGELPGAPAHAILDPSSRGDLLQVLRAARRGATSGSGTFRLRHADGTAVPVRASWSVLAGVGPDASQLVFVCADQLVGEAARHRLHMQEAFDRLAREAAVVADAQGTLLFASPAVGALLGYEVDDVLAAELWDFLHPDDLPSARAGYQAVVDGAGPRTASLRVRAALGDWRWVELVAVNLLDDAVGGIVCSVHDITAEVEAKQALRSSETRFRALAGTSDEGVWILGPKGETLYANARLAAILGMPPEQAHDPDLMFALDPEAAAAVGGRLRTPREPGPERYEIPYAHPDGKERRLRIAVVPLHGEDRTHEGSLAVVSDVTDVRRAEQELRVAALQDGLTGLPNRTLLVDRLTHTLAWAQESTAVLLVDLDRFSLVNDSRGHGVGDELLTGVGARLLSTVSGQATVARFGGDEFAVVCEDADERRAHSMAREILAALGEPFSIDGAPVHVTASIGVAVAPSGQSPSATELLRRADTAVHAAKDAGRGRIHLFDDRLGADVEQRYALAADLRTALADQALDVEFQPIVDLQSGTVVGIETLARWTHPDRGPVPPTSFVPVAELTGLAPELDRWVIRRALHDMAALRTAGVVPGDAFLAVNLSAGNLTDSFVFDELLSWTEETGLPADQLVLEITETAIMQNTELAAELLRRLREHGFRVAMDDFGTGYSSLAFLRDLPISALKIDRSFVADITEQEEALAIVASIVDLARAVGVSVTAEGVETAEQAALLQRLGCVTAQGWLWSPAVPLTALLSGREWISALGTAGEATVRARTTWRGMRDVSVAHGLKRLQELHQDGASPAAVAAALNAEGFRTPGGLRWHRSSVARVIAHQIRRGAGTPEASSGTPGATWRAAAASRRPSRFWSALGRPYVRPPGDEDDAG